MIRADVKVTLKIKGPLLTQSTAPGEYGLDAVVARNADNVPYVAGSHVAGKIRQALEEIANCTALCPWYTTEVKDQITGKPGSDYQPASKSVFFSDFLLQTLEEKRSIRTRIQIDPQLGAVKKGAQLFIDSPFASGEPIFFAGEIIFFVNDQDTLTTFLEHIEAALKWTTQLGGYRSIGFGRLENVIIKPAQQKKYSSAGIWPGSGKTVDLQIQPSHPFCIAGKQVDTNLFEAEAVMPGGAVLGSIATTWRCLAGEAVFCKINELKDTDRTELQEVFNDIRITHAFPSADGLLRPVVPPLSLVKIDRDKEQEDYRPYYDVALCDRPCLIHDQTPAFKVDWKESADVLKDFGWPQTDKEMRVRTAIDPKYLRSEDSALFAYEMIVPKNLTWVSSITVPEHNADKTRSQLASLLSHGIAGLGKTKTAASTQLLAAGSVKPYHATELDHASRLEAQDGFWIITLQTPALLCDPTRLINSGNQQELHAAYEADWLEISGKSLQLVRFFACQKLAGGKYLYSRFQRGRDDQGNEKPYYPWLLTTEGSVFILKVNSGKGSEAQKLINQWFAKGLPMPAWAKKQYSVTKNGKQVDGSHWTACPFIRQNGYGEIAVNLDIHWNALPKDNIRRDIDWIGHGEEA